MLVDASIQSLAKAINTSWRKTTDSVLETAALCANANKKLDAVARKKLVELLDCSSATFSKLATIGEQEALQSDPIKSLLPVSYSIVYEIAKLPLADLNAAVEGGVINHKMTRADIAAWVAERNGAGLKTFVEIKPIVIGTLQLPPDYDGTRQIQLEKDLEKLRAKYGFSLERPLDSEGVAFDRMGRNIDYDIRKEARQFIKKLKSHRLNKSLVKLSATEKKKLWPYANDEIEIAQDASWDRVQAVLELVGNADQFERIRDEVLRLSGMPEDVVSSHPLQDHDEAMEEMRKAVAQQKSRMKPKYDASKFADFK